MKRLLTIFLTLFFLTTVASVSFGQKDDGRKKTDKDVKMEKNKNRKKKTEETKKP